ncbi:MAG: efflux RND transporter periplasmic adaptor subunit [Candidatus Riflebacteria bacterium]|nr:efflux RND transporter periplasmic adaptor subunit [Candidatus Riflebacteria bacterium]
MVPIDGPGTPPAASAPSQAAGGSPGSGPTLQAGLRAEELARLRIHRLDEPRQASGGGFWSFMKFLVVVATLAGGAYWSHEKGMWSTAPEVDVVTVTREGDRPSSGRLTASGYVIARVKANLGFKVPGRISQLFKREGDKVGAGEVLAQLEDRDVRAQLDRARATADTTRAVLSELEAGSRRQEIARAGQAVKEAEANNWSALQTLRRYEELLKRGSIAPQQVDTARAVLNASTAQLESARQAQHLVQEGPRKELIAAQRARVAEVDAAVKVAQEQLFETKLRAPFAGVIIERQSEIGETLTFSTDTRTASGITVMTLADLDDLEVEVDISETNLSQVVEGGGAEVVTDAYPDRKYKALVRQIMPRANRQKAIVPVKVKILDVDSRLKPDMSAKVTFMLKGEEAGKPAVTKVLMPRRAVRRQGDGAFVYVVREGTAREAPVSLGEVEGEMVLVKQGLLGGEDVVVDGSARLTNGAKVRTKGEARRP